MKSAPSAPFALPHVDACAVARQAGLRYVNDGTPGIVRKPFGKRFRYTWPDGKPLRDRAALARIASLAIPPAWTDVWICARDDGHLQATGRDVRGRKQYRYHRRWRAVRDEAKYGGMLNFGRALPALRRAVETALGRPGLPREKVLATIVHLLQTTMMRIGNEEYARTNASFGLTTLRSWHVRIDGSDIAFNFRGKSGVFHAVKVHDRRLARLIGRMRELPGQELFQYVGDDGAIHAVGSADVNDYLRAITGEDYTAKDFRTWFGTVLAALALREFEQAKTQAQARKNIVRAIESVAERLGNTPAICRKCYVHPAVIEAYLEGTTLAMPGGGAGQAPDEETRGLRAEEVALLELLRDRVQHVPREGGAR
ncbi:DNA topoisomerase IB [Massilia glaciei]|uniref:DNA topoisomerase n=2 Tax=Massilia glaciei TaxID=1524097 RepID=A0A2U2HEY8_9BURK|nr:DNA topoisomerase IB [Massilia glaciei]